MTHVCPDCGCYCDCAEGNENEFACQHCDEIDPDDLPECDIAEDD